MYCLNCDARLLTGAKAQSCTQCGQPFSRRDPSTYAERSPLVRPHRWLPGVLLACAIVIAPYGFGVRDMALDGFTFLVSPFIAGIVLGLLTPPTVAFLMTVPLPIFLVVVGSFLSGAGWAGVACLGIFLAMLIPIVLLGALIGGIFRRRRMRGRASLASITKVFGFWLALMLGNRALPVDQPVETLETATVISAPPAVVWQHLHFYEEIDAEPPLLLRLGLPVPVRAVGSKAAVGDVEVCVYDGGHKLVKRIVAREEARRLSFVVITQELGFEHDVTLRGGAFTLTPLPGGATRLTLETEYVPHCTPRWLWRPIEAEVVHTLHRHITAEIRRLCGNRYPFEAGRPLRAGSSR